MPAEHLASGRHASWPVRPALVAVLAGTTTEVRKTWVAATVAERLRTSPGDLASLLAGLHEGLR